MSVKSFAKKAVTSFAFLSLFSYGIYDNYWKNISIDTNQPSSTDEPSRVLLESNQIKKKQTPNNVNQEVIQAQQNKQNENEKKPQKEQSHQIELTWNSAKSVQNISQLKQYDFSYQPNKDELIMIVADLPFREEFEQKVLNAARKVEAKLKKKVKIFRKDILQNKNKKILKDKFNVDVKEETLFLLKNTYDGTMVNIDFDMFFQFPSLMEVYLNDIHLIDRKGVFQFKKSLKNISENDPYLIYIFDEEEEKLKERMLTAKFVEMELAINGYDNVKLFAVSQKGAIQQGLVKPQKCKVNSVHMIKKHNDLSYSEPNFYLQNNSSHEQAITSFHFWNDIALYAKGRKDLLLQYYLSEVQTFGSASLNYPTILSLKIDKNRIEEKDYSNLLQLFAQLKRSKDFPNVSFTLKHGAVTPKEGRENAFWEIALADMDYIEKQTSLHDISTEQELKSIGISEKDYMKHSKQYFYQHTSVSIDLLKQFIKDSIDGKNPQFYRSEKRDELSTITKITSSSFSKQIIKDNKDHLIYQYSDHCPTCKEITPLFKAFNQVIQSADLGLKELKFHRLNCDKNRIKEFISTPYTPNIYYFKDQWKHKGPVRFNIEFFQKGLLGIYDFCNITKEIKTIEWSLIEKAIKASQVV